MAKLDTDELSWIKWIDSQSWNGWRDRNDALKWAKEETMICESVGWILYESEDRVVISSHKAHGADMVDDVWIIPKSAIIERMRID